MPLDAKYLRSKKRKDQQVYVCKNFEREYRPLERIPQFEQQARVFLPLPIHEINKLYEDVGIDRQTDYFYSTVIQRIKTNTYHKSKRYIDDICDARPIAKPLDLQYVFNPRKLIFQEDEDGARVVGAFKRLYYKYHHYIMRMLVMAVNILWDVLLLYILYRSFIVFQSLVKRSPPQPPSSSS